MTASEVKRKYEQNDPDGHFFDRSTMRFFGDTMSNFGCYDGGHSWVIYRKKPVQFGLMGNFAFQKETFKYMGKV